MVSPVSSINSSSAPAHSSAPGSPISALTPDLLEKVFSNLSPRVVASGSSVVSHEWHAAIVVPQAIIQENLEKILTALQSSRDWDNGESESVKNVGLVFGDASQTTRNLTVKRLIAIFNKRTQGQLDILRQQHNSINIITPKGKQAFFGAMAAKYLRA